MKDLPEGSRGVVADNYPGGEHGHVMRVVHTEHGIAFVDPQSGDLAYLPPNAHSVKFLPTHNPSPQLSSPSPRHTANPLRTRRIPMGTTAPIVTPQTMDLPNPPYPRTVTPPSTLGTPAPTTIVTPPSPKWPQTSASPIPSRSAP